MRTIKIALIMLVASLFLGGNYKEHQAVHEVDAFIILHTYHRDFPNAADYYVSTTLCIASTKLIDHVDENGLIHQKEQLIIKNSITIQDTGVKPDQSKELCRPWYNHKTKMYQLQAPVYYEIYCDCQCNSTVLNLGTIQLKAKELYEIQETYNPSTQRSMQYKFRSYDNDDPVSEYIKRELPKHHPLGHTCPST